MRLIFDGHLDLAWNAMSWDRDLTLDLDRMNRAEAGMTDHPARGRATTSLPEMRRGGIAACQATLLSRSRPQARKPEGSPRMSLDFPTSDLASAHARGQLAYYFLLERRGLLQMIRTASHLDAHWAAWESGEGEGPAAPPIGYILAMEGADPIVEPEQASAWWNLGLRSVNLVHYGANRYAVGTGADGPLTSDGVRLLKEFERLGMILDATHLSDTSFFQALATFDGPVLASHNNCRSLVPDQRQFTDDQIRLLLERDAVIGVALDAWMLAPGWVRGQTSREVVRLEALADHIDHITQLAGKPTNVAIGSDLDGGFGTEQVPAGLDRISDLQKLDAILSARGYDSAAIDAIFHGNWLRFFRRTLPA
ncbi:Membrane dipeptidase (Peptidase family M19) [Aquisphaera giovannonii]|uniref:Membrane dipeptidase (Peptidase family M19) n=1 Tax=Aquisphaera giovannonii TaxID=406548 RepID=A0A5B9VV98_9BACT|nr:membrane dipeptidase [Aquisphaera giovannonii]QEH32283.1 Membrane dipeptidase (Peptidase family M19) [Aquisphaera giovannonii]